MAASMALILLFGVNGISTELVLPGDETTERLADLEGVEGADISAIQRQEQGLISVMLD